MQIELQSCIVATADQVSCGLAGEAAILNLKSGVYYGLNPVGAYIWNLVQQPKAVQEVLDAVLGEYEVGQAQCQTDLMRLLNDLAEQGLIEVK